VHVCSKSGSVPETTIDLRIHIGNDSRDLILREIEKAITEFRHAIYARLDALEK
jgi:hypothetical protein